jgi:hypothetical protein
VSVENENNTRKLYFIIYGLIFLFPYRKNTISTCFIVELLIAVLLQYQKTSKSFFMKRLSLFLFASLIILAGCNNNKPKDSITISTDEGKGEMTINPNQMQKAAEEMEKQKTELEKLTPLTLDQLKALLPETLMGVPRKSYEANATMGAGLASAKYEINDSMDVQLNIYDCAGPAGAGIYGLQYLGMMNIQQESDDEYTKSVDFNGGKAFEHCQKSRD